MDLFVRQSAAQRFESFGDPGDRAALTQREAATSQGIRIEREAQHGALSCLSVDDQSDEPRGHCVKTLMRVRRDTGGEQGRRGGLRVDHDEQRSLVCEVSVRGGAGDSCGLRTSSTVGVAPSFTSVRAAAIRLSLVRCFCRERPPAS